MLVTVTWGGASSGYCAIGSVGILTAPARMITSEQTLAMIGRLIKVSTNMSVFRTALGTSLRRAEERGPRYRRTLFVRYRALHRRCDRHAVDQLLHARNH